MAVREGQSAFSGDELPMGYPNPTALPQTHVHKSNARWTQQVKEMSREGEVVNLRGSWEP